jgi:hypothetical protein
VEAGSPVVMVVGRSAQDHGWVFRFGAPAFFIRVDHEARLIVQI